MTKAQALHNFFSGFGLTAYTTTNVADGTQLPYLTYEPQIGNNGLTAYISVSLWYWTDSEAVPNAKADAISKAIGQGVSIPCDDGAIYIYAENPWQTVKDDQTPELKHKTTNLTIIFNTF